MVVRGRVGQEGCGGQTHSALEVHISRHPCYRTMWDYLRTPSERKPASELDQGSPFLSPGHPAPEALVAPPPHLREAWRARTQCEGGQAAEGVDRQRGEAYTVLRLYDLLKEKRLEILSEDDLWAYANQR